MTEPKKDITSKVGDTPAKKSGVFDVARPGSGQIATSTTSKSTIISSHPTMRDPMMVSPSNDADKPAEAPETAPVLAPTKKKVIMPLSDMKASAESESPATEEAEPAEATQEPQATEPVAAAEEEPVVQTESGKPVTVLEPASNAGVPSEKREEKALSTEQIAAAKKTAEEREAKLREMVEDEQYFLPINAAQERRSRRVAIIGLFVIIVLALAWYNVALDAGLLPNQFNVPHTGFFTIK
jgi:hypothetical protein